jgi:hypothetical protein
MSMMRPIHVVCLLVSLLAGVAGGCGRGQERVPVGAQKVHVAVTESEVRLDPAVVRAGDVYVVLDTPGSTVGFATRKATEAETPGPFTDEELERLAQGDWEFTAVEGFADTGCSDAQRAADRGLTGYCGNVFKERLTPGKYAFFICDGDVGAPRSIAVLEVLP